ncbi:MAG: FAD binding domain-containing protein [Candidatus Omnitrophica bacterium]|nr:FAD binding domain-containing protein [Candidatus Omnitrophota bacterium]
MLLNKFTYHSPKEISEAIELLDDKPNSKILAGGTILIANLKLFKQRNMPTPEHIISLRKIPELKGINIDTDSITIGAMTTINELQQNTHVKKNLSIIKTCCENLATTPIRNMATIGGNLTCRYTWTELSSVMVALDAQFIFRSESGIKTISAENYFFDQAKQEGILTHIKLKLNADRISAFKRIGKRAIVDKPMLSISVSAIAQNKKINDSRIVINNGYSFAIRDKKAENFLNGKNLNISLVKDILQHIDTEIFDSRSDDYKKHMSRMALTDTIEQLVQQCK